MLCLLLIYGIHLRTHVVHKFQGVFLANKPSSPLRKPLDPVGSALFHQVYTIRAQPPTIAVQAWKSHQTQLGLSDYSLIFKFGQRKFKLGWSIKRVGHEQVVTHAMAVSILQTGSILRPSLLRLAISCHETVLTPLAEDYGCSSLSFSFEE